MPLKIQNSNRAILLSMSFNYRLTYPLILAGVTLFTPPALSQVLIQAPPTNLSGPVFRPLSSGVPALATLKQSYRVPHFRLGGRYTPGDPEGYARGGIGGTTLESLGAEPLKLSYITLGTPRRNARGGITNAIIVSSYYSGDASYLYHYWAAGQKGNAFSKGAIIGPGKLIDTRKYYVVFLDALGLFGTSKPSDGLGPGFPQYSLMDMVQANYRLLKDHLGIDQVKLAMGPSMGAMQTYLWAAMHPGYVQGILPIGGTLNTHDDAVVHHLFQLMTAAIQSDPVWRETQGLYYHLPKSNHPNQGVEFGWSLIGTTGISLDAQYAEGWESRQKNSFSWSTVKNPEAESKLGSALRVKSRDYDANDLLYRNAALFAFDMQPFVKQIRAKSLILHVQNDQWLRVQNARQAANTIPGARLLTFEDPLAHYAIFKAPNQFKEEIRAFLQALGD